MGRAVARDVVAQANGGQGDKDEIQSIKDCPVRLKKIDKYWGNNDWKHHEDWPHQSQMNKANLEEKVFKD